ncbi:Pentatricopeptide repeat [Trema orientale]|uniref:Pentatricopeptide repeat n=1 Tax=Trema orientale TaxID=63057 RepID=A0A2P5D6X1_TREOI|nr:Pentatricopeptide repeat [Trema orientale]
MALTSLGSSSPWLSRLSLPYNHCYYYAHNNHTLLFKSLTSLKYLSRTLTTKASLGESETSSSTSTSTSSSNGVAENNPVSEVFDVELLNQVSGAKDAYEVLQMIGERSERSGGFVSVSDCLLIISAALDRNNPDLALSVFNAMRSSFDQGITETGSFVEKWKWSRPDVRVYTSLVQGLAASLRVSDALRMINNICQVGVSPAEEVPFGKVVRCPGCMIAVAVAQPQQGIQIVSCSTCRYQYELVSGNIVSIESEEISMDVPAWQRGLRFLQIKKRGIPAAVHSIVVQTPSGMARTHRFATETVDLPAQEGERVTIALAAPSNVYRQIGPFKFSPKAPNFYPGEPICLTNHEDDRESQLLRAPVKDKGSSLTNPSILFPLVAVLASGDAASGVIDPSLPQFISVAAVASLAVGATLNTLVFPQLSKLPQRSVDTVAIKQQLLSQYDILQSRIRGLKEAAEKEVWMLARMCQLENKIFAVGEPTYRARRNKIKKVREGLENSLRGRIELIDSYARISSMIEIEVEMDSDVLAAEAASSAESIAEQIQQIMELENLEEACAPDWSYYFLGGMMGNGLIDRWKLQAEANDEAERLLSSQPLPTEQV